MQNKKITGKIYETDRFGNEEEFDVETSDRMDKMLGLIQGLKVKPKNILDIGSGVGFFANYLKTIYKASEIYAVDISKTAIAEGKRRYKKVHFAEADAEKKLPFKDSMFDLVISGNHIEHLVDVDSYLEEINRVTKKGGSMVLTTPNLGSWLNRMLLLFGKQPYFLDASLVKTLPIFELGSYTFPELLNYPSSGHLRLYTLNMLKKLLLLYGFKTTKTRGAMLFKKPILFQIDKFFTHIPSLALRLVVKAEKAQNI